MSKRSVVIVCLLALTLAACPKKEDAAGTDAASVVVDSAAAPAVTATADAEPEVALDAATAAPKTVVVAKVSDAGVVVVDAGVVTDAGALAADACCCEVTGQPLSQVGQSECTKTRKGHCVKNEKCAAAPAVVVVDAGPPAQQCCCDTAGKKERRGQSECTKGGGAGKCVKTSECK